tara:strand:+ start:259 stop:501 length:243 start_codon:yes stop_codon:yes gene_type:complete
MFPELTRDRYKALEVLADHIRYPSKDLILNAILRDVSDEDLQWVSSKIHYYLLRLLEDVDYDRTDDDLALLTTTGKDLID